MHRARSKAIVSTHAHAPATIAPTWSWLKEKSLAGWVDAEAVAARVVIVGVVITSIDVVGVDDSDNTDDTPDDGGTPEDEVAEIVEAIAATAGASLIAA